MARLLSTLQSNRWRASESRSPGKRRYKRWLQNPRGRCGSRRSRWSRWRWGASWANWWSHGLKWVNNSGAAMKMSCCLGQRLPKAMVASHQTRENSATVTSRPDPSSH